MYRIQQAQAQINTTTAGSVFASIDQFRGVLNTVSTGMTSISSLTDPTYGMLAGLNCKIFGQDFVTFQNVICGSFFTNIYLIRLTFGIASWASSSRCAASSAPECGTTSRPTGGRRWQRRSATITRSRTRVRSGS